MFFFVALVLLLPLPMFASPPLQPVVSISFSVSPIHPVVIGISSSENYDSILINFELKFVELNAWPVWIDMYNILCDSV